MNKSRETKATVLTILSTIIFGLSFIFIKLNVDSMSVFVLLSWRLIVAALTMTILILVGVFKINLKEKSLKTPILMAIFQPCVYYSMEAIGVKYTNASESGIITSIIPVVTMIMAAIILKDKPTKKQGACVILSVIGVLMIAAEGGVTASASIIGYVALAFAVLGDGVYNIIGQNANDYTAYEKTYVMVVMGAIVFTGIAVVEALATGTFTEYITMPFTNVRFLISILYLGIGCNMLGFIFTNYGLSVLGATRRTTFCGIATVTSVIGGVFYLKEPYTLFQAAATVAIIIGIYGANKFAAKKE